LVDARLRASGWWRFARTVGVVLAVLHTAAVIVLATNGLGHQVHSVVTRVAVLTAWFGGAAVAWWNAGNPAAADHAHGIDLLARVHGIRPQTLAFGRLCAPGLRVAALILLMSSPVLGASLASAASLNIAAWRLASVLPLVAFALSVGVVAGPIAATCGWLSPRHGRSLLFAMLVVPWSLDGMLSGSRACTRSITGMLGFVADLVTKMGGTT